MPFPASHRDDTHGRPCADTAPSSRLEPGGRPGQGQHKCNVDQTHNGKNTHTTDLEPRAARAGPEQGLPGGPVQRQEAVPAPWHVHPQPERRGGGRGPCRGAGAAAGGGSSGGSTSGSGGGGGGGGGGGTSLDHDAIDLCGPRRMGAKIKLRESPAERAGRTLVFGAVFFGGEGKGGHTLTREQQL